MLLVGAAGLVLRANGLKFRSVVQSIEPPFSSGLAGVTREISSPGAELTRRSGVA